MKTGSIMDKINGLINNLFKKSRQKNTPDTEMALEILMLVQEALDNKEDPERLTAALGRIQQVANRVLGERTPLLTGPQAERAAQIEHLSSKKKEGMSFDRHEELTEVHSTGSETELTGTETEAEKGKEKEAEAATEVRSIKDPEEDAGSIESSKNEDEKDAAEAEDIMKEPEVCTETEEDVDPQPDEISKEIETAKKEEVIVAENYDEMLKILRGVPEKTISIPEVISESVEEDAEPENTSDDVQEGSTAEVAICEKEVEEKPEEPDSALTELAEEEKPSVIETADQAMVETEQGVVKTEPVAEPEKAIIEENECSGEAIEPEAEKAESIAEAGSEIEPLQPDRFIGKKVLYAYGNAPVEGLISEVCNTWQIDLERVANGLAAVKQFSASEPGTYDAIILEKSMPLMNGFMAAKCIRKDKHPESETVPVIIAAAGTPVGQIEREMENISACLNAGTEQEIYDVFSDIWKGRDEPCA